MTAQKLQNPNTPATRSDIDELAQATRHAFDRIERGMATREDLRDFVTKEDSARFATKDDLAPLATKDDVARVLRIQESILKTVESIDGRLAEMSDHTERIIRLEDEVFAPGK